jgi:hypothetical protein
LMMKLAWPGREPRVNLVPAISLLLSNGTKGRSLLSLVPLTHCVGAVPVALVFWLSVNDRLLIKLAWPGREPRVNPVPARSLLLSNSTKGRPPLSLVPLTHCVSSVPVALVYWLSVNDRLMVKLAWPGR